jgi:hypothetical protein
MTVEIIIACLSISNYRQANQNRLSLLFRRFPFGPLQGIPADLPTLDSDNTHPISPGEFIPSERVDDSGAQRHAQHANPVDSLVCVERRLDHKSHHVVFYVHVPVHLLCEEMPDGRDARRASLTEPRLEPFPRLFRSHLVIRRVQRRVDSDEPDELVRVFEDPKSRGGRACVMGLDVQEVYTSEDLLGRVFYRRSVFPSFREERITF